MIEWSSRGEASGWAPLGYCGMTLNTKGSRTVRLSPLTGGISSQMEGLVSTHQIYGLRNTAPLYGLIKKENRP